MAEGAQAKTLEEKMRELAVTATDKNPKDITLSRIKTADFLEKKHFELLDHGLFASIVKQIGSKNKAIPLNKANCDLFVSQLAHKAVCEKTGKKDLPMEDESVVAEKDKIYNKIMTHKVKTLETKTANKGSVSRLTDTSKYTGTHGQRFDAEGKGKGAAGRVDKVENTGYVGQYKGQDTFGKK